MGRLNAWLQTYGEAVWRASRTARQVLWGVLSAALLAALTTYQATHVFPWSQLYYDGVILGVATVVAFYQNRPKTIPADGKDDFPSEDVGGTDI